MTGPDFLPLAGRLAAGTTEPEWRTAVSRAYYASFHVARELLEGFGFRVPRSDRAHAHVWLRLGNCGEPVVQAAAGDFQGLRGDRNLADYDLNRSVAQAFATAGVQTATRVIQRLQAAAQEPTRSQITAAMCVYERDVLRDVTWQGP